VSRRPAGANNFLKWRRSIVEHLELRRITWHEFAMFAWLCTKASPQTGILRTSWPTLARETGLSADHVEQLCRALKRKSYLWYLSHRGARRRLVEVAIDKFPTADGGYTDLSARFQTGAARVPRAGATDSPSELLMEALTELPTDLPTDVPTDLPTDVLTDLPMDVPTDLRAKRTEESQGLPPGRLRKRREREKEREREREEDRACARAQDRKDGRDHNEGRDPKEGRNRNKGQDPAPAWRENLATPVAIREILATQSWWRPPADDCASSSGPDPGGTRDGGRATATTDSPPGRARR
jgi:hypothetical protein